MCPVYNAGVILVLKTRMKYAKYVDMFGLKQLLAYNAFCMFKFRFKVLLGTQFIGKALMFLNLRGIDSLSIK